MNKKFNLLLLTSALICLINLGPASAQWVSSGPDGGFVVCMAQSNNIIYAVSGNVWFTAPGLFSSSDNGNIWSSVPCTSLPNDIRAIETSGNYLFLGTGSGIYRSDDSGLTWVLKNNGFPGGDKWINHLAISGSTLFAAGTSQGMLRSTDNGENWTVVNAGLSDTYVYSLLANENAVFAGTGDQLLGVFRSTNNGDTWQQVKNGMGYYYNGTWLYSDAPMITALSFVGSDLYAGTAENQGIWKSSDYGDNWVFTSMETMNYQWINAISGNESAVIAGSLQGSGVIRSINDGATWTDANNGIDNYGRINSFLSIDVNIFVCTKGGIYKSVDSGGKWTAASNGIKVQNVTYPGFATFGNDLYIGTEHGGVFHSSDEGLNWDAVNNGLPLNEWNLNNLYSNQSALFAWDRVSFDGGTTWGMRSSYSPGSVGFSYDGPGWLEHGNAWFAISSGNNGGVFRSTDNGQNWTTINSGIPDPASIQFFIIYSKGTTLFLCTSDGFYYSNDNGNSWIKGIFPDIYSWSLSGSSFVTSGSSDICGLSGGGGSRGIYRSNDNGANWIQVGELLVHKFVKNGNSIFASGTNLELINGEEVEVPRILMSQDEGQSWTNVSPPFSGISTSSLAGDGSNIYISKYSLGDNSVYCSIDNGTTWIEITDGLNPNTYVSSFYIWNDKIFAGTNGSSVWKRNLAEFTSPSQPSGIIGEQVLCAGSTLEYSVANVPGVIYSWQVPQDWTINIGNGTNSINVTAGNSSGIVLVIPSNAFGAGPAQFQVVTVNYIPVTPLISQIGTTLSSDALIGNQWFKNDTLINGATDATFEITLNGSYYSIVSINGCSSSVSNILNIYDLSIDNITSAKFNIFPIPSTGLFYLQTKLLPTEKIDIKVFNSIGIQVYETKEVASGGTDIIKIDIPHIPSGVYVVKIIIGNNKVIRKMMINHDN